MNPDKPRRAPRRWKAWTAFLLLAFVVAIAGTPWPARHFGLEGIARTAVEQHTGLHLDASRGEPMLRLLPTPRLIIKGPRFEGDGLTVTAGELDLRLGATLFLPGGPGVTRAVLVAPTAVVTGSVPIDPLAIGLRLLTETSRLPTLVIRDGTWTDTVSDRRASEINLSLVPGRSEKALRLNGLVAGERLSLSAGLAPAAATGVPRAAKLSVESAPLSISFDGEATTGSGQLVTGNIRVALDSPKRLGGWLDETLRETIAGKLVVAGIGRLRREGFQLNDAVIETPAGTLSGTLAGRFDSAQRPSLSGTLHTPTADLRQLLRPVSDPDSWLVSAHLRRLLPLADVDFRLSARRLLLAEQPMEDAAIALLVRNGRLEGSLGETRLGRGTLRSRLTLQDSGSGFELRAQGQWDRIDIRSLAGDRLAPHLTGGQTGGQFQIEAQGSNGQALLASLGGRLSLSLADGETTSFDLTRLSQRPPRGGQTGIGRNVQGRGTLDQVQTVLRIVSGRIDIAEGFLRSGNTRAALSGGLDLAGGLFAIDLAVPPPRAEPSGRLSGRLLVRGDWPHLSYLFEATEAGDASVVIAP